MSWVSFLPILSLLHPSILDLGSGTGQTDNGHQCTMSPPYGGGGIKTIWQVSMSH